MLRLPYPVSDRFLVCAMIAVLASVAALNARPLLHSAAASLDVLRNELDGAEQHLLAAVENARESGSYESLTTALERLVTIYDDQHRYGDAERALSELLRIHESRLGKKHPTVADVLERLGVAALRQGRYASAEGWFRRSIALREEIFGPRDPRTASSFLHLGSLFHLQRDIRRADLYLERALSILDSEQQAGLNRLSFSWLTGPPAIESEVRLMRAGALYELSAVRVAQGSSREAKRLALRAQSLLADSDLSPVLEAAVLSHLGALCQAGGDSRGALRYYAQGQEIVRRGNLAESRIDAALLTNAAVAEAAVGRQGRALAALDRARRIASERFPEDVALSRFIASSATMVENHSQNASR